VGINIAVLYTIDGEPYQAFRISNVHITPNTFISIVSTVSKSSFLLPVAESISQLKWIYFQQRPHRIRDLQAFDNASRGPLGALKLVASMRLSAVAASMGAILTILALAIDPFTQQILSYPTHEDVANNITASIGSARYFQLDSIGQGNNKNSDNYLPNAVFRLNAAMSAAVFGSPVQSTFTCPSGHCQWETFDSLAMCSQCIDVSN